MPVDIDLYYIDIDIITWGLYFLFIERLLSLKCSSCSTDILKRIISLSDKVSDFFFTIPLTAHE